MKKITLQKFKSDINKLTAFTPPIAFWYKFIHEQYKRDILSYDEALKRVLLMKDYRGV